MKVIGSFLGFLFCMPGITVALVPLSFHANAGSATTRIEPSSILLAGSTSSDDESSLLDRRKTIIGLLATGGGLLSSASNALAAEGDDESSFASIASRASKLSKELDKEASQAAISQRTTDKTVYDFELPVDGTLLPFSQVINQGTTPDGDVRVKAILVTNMKQDDPIARKTIPQLISLASKYGRGDSGLAVVSCPSDQGYYEPDTSKLIRLKLASEYGYGINPSTIVTDKVNLLGTGAHPFWRWLESNCRTPGEWIRVVRSYNVCALLVHICIRSANGKTPAFI